MSCYDVGVEVCLPLPYLIQMGLGEVLGGGGKIGLGRVVFHACVSSICRAIGDRERGMGRIVVGDCSVDLGVLGVVNVID